MAKTKVITPVYKNVGPCTICGCSLPNGECQIITDMREDDEKAFKWFADKGYPLDEPIGAYLAWQNIPVLQAQAEANKRIKEASQEYHKSKASEGYVPKLFSKQTSKKGGTTSVYRDEHALRFFLYVFQIVSLGKMPDFDKNSFTDQELNKLVEDFMTDILVDERHHTLSTHMKNETLFVNVIKRPVGEGKHALGHVLSMWTFFVSKLGTLSIHNVYSDNLGTESREWLFLFP